VQDAKQIGTPAARRSGRVRKEIGILLIGSDAQGRDFMEETKTVVLSRHGAGIVSKHKLYAEQELILVELGSNKEAEIRIVGQIGSADDVYTYGVAFLNGQLDFWQAEFPATAAAQPSKSTVLQCSRCGASELLASGAFELDIYAIHGQVLRDCKSCKHSTRWTEISIALESAAPLPEGAASSSKSASSSEVQAPAAPVANRRKYPRISVHFTAFVRSAGSEDQLVYCENVSRGGVCFKSSKRFRTTSRIEVAAPYIPGSACILVPAEIVHVEEIPGEQMFRCGVHYLDSRSDARA
jgi:hypothetical protein